MSSRTRNTFILIIVLALVGAGAWFFYFRQGANSPQKIFQSIFGGGNPAPASNNEPSNEGTSSPPSENQQGERSPGLYQITSQETTGPIFTGRGEVFRYLARADSHIFEINATSSSWEPKELSGTTLADALDAFWSSDATKVVVKFFSLGKIRHFVINLTETPTSFFLPDDITSLRWSPSGKELAFTRAQNNHSALVVAGSNGKNQTTLLDSPMPDLRMQWILADEFVLASPASGFAQTPTLLFKRTGGLSLLKPALFGSQALFSPKADRFLFSQTDRDGKNLFTTIQDRGGKILYSFPVGTLKEKCVWASDNITIFCAVPSSLNGKEVMPDDFYQGRFLSPDGIFKIDSTKGTSELVGDLSFPVEKLAVSPSKSDVLVVNKENGSLWLLKLK